MLLMLYKFCKGKKYTEILGNSDDFDSSKKSISWLIQIYFAVCWLCFEVSKLFLFVSACLLGSLQVQSETTENKISPWSRY